ncbi:unnamed protein product [Nesidiocoris tenuis]|uniref:Uncharacterized protein n=1 Tax=Nesidiocoris tenuis TaxID=355587 RepID=A0A6H5HKL5_9HEMI|nr:unnamed protein product [Nesidiocoris tenuis]
MGSLLANIDSISTSTIIRRRSVSPLWPGCPDGSRSDFLLFVINNSYMFGGRHHETIVWISLLCHESSVTMLERNPESQSRLNTIQKNLFKIFKKKFFLRFPIKKNDSPKVDPPYCPNAEPVICHVQTPAESEKRLNFEEKSSSEEDSVSSGSSVMETLPGVTPSKNDDA